MRAAFASTLTELAANDPRIFLLTGDLGYMALEPFAEKFPDRFLNVGVAEQNMVGIATGLAEAGFIPFVYSIVTFATLRPYEFIRNGPILHNLPVRIVGVGGGLEYGHNGMSHYGLEDVGVMRLQPGITLVAPADYQQTKEALRKTWNLTGPVYYRLGKDDKTSVPGLDGRFEVGQAQLTRPGDDLLIVSMGSITVEAQAAAEILMAQYGISSAVLVVSSVKPPPVADLKYYLAKYTTVITVEAHYAVGGLGSLVSEIVAENALGSRVVVCAVKSQPSGEVGSQSYLYRKCGLSKDALVETCLAALRGVKT